MGCCYTESRIHGFAFLQDSGLQNPPRYRQCANTTIVRLEHRKVNKYTKRCCGFVPYIKQTSPSTRGLVGTWGLVGTRGSNGLPFCFLFSPSSLGSGIAIDESNSVRWDGRAYPPSPSTSPGLPVRLVCGIHYPPDRRSPNFSRFVEKLI